MVKALIKGLFTKKEGKDKATEGKNSEEVPDELPPLAEELMEKLSSGSKEETIEKPKEGQKEAKIELQEEEPEGQSAQEQDIGEIIEDKEEAGNLGKPEKFEGLKPISAKKEDYPKKEPKEEEIEKAAVEQPEPDDEKSFFSDILSITKNQGISEKILSQDLYKRMKDYWHYHPSSSRLKNKEKLEQEILYELAQLKKLEERWLTQKRFLEEDRRILLEKERDIKTNTEKLQKVLNQLKFYKDVEPKHYFWLENGAIVKNIHELMNLLEVIDNETFNKHVNKSKNDFINWVRNSVGEKELAEKLGKAKTREEMAVILENALSGNIDLISPENYFRMGNGMVIRI